MGDRGHNRHEPKTGGLCPFQREGGAELRPNLTQHRPGRVYIRTKWHLDPSSRLATTDMGQKLGGGCARFLGSWVPIDHKVA